MSDIYVSTIKAQLASAESVTWSGSVKGELIVIQNTGDTNPGTITVGGAIFTIWPKETLILPNISGMYEVTYIDALSGGVTTITVAAYN